ncbi:hypothetical protein [Rhodococcus sp. X156]|uniref:hypothetical protein n=1 Tax=Rhodococcus sp. X156 TaxID=2499145 RepID=UPI000FD78FA3|nr:hypothetical protein [Rhodococcus sp. X156]
MVIAALAALWLVFSLVVRRLRRRGLTGEHPGVGVVRPEQLRESRSRPSRSWREGHRPWHE